MRCVNKTVIIVLLIGFSHFAAASDSLDAWHIRRTWTYPDGVKDVIYANNRFVAVGKGIYTSPDGILWTKNSFSVPNELNAVTYGNDQFVAVGYSGAVVTSPNGTTWTSRIPRTTNILYGVAYGNGKYVAVGSNNVVLISADGTQWTMAVPNASSNSFRRIKFCKGRFVAAACDIGDSLDGVNWTFFDQGGSRPCAVDIACSDDLYATVSASATLYISANLETWTKIESISQVTTNSLWAITYAYNTFVAVGDDNTIITSNDGSTWILRPSPVSDNFFHDLYGVTPGRGTFVTGGNYEMLQAGLTFADVPSGSWAEDYIYNLYYSQVTSGCVSNPPLYCPDEPVTRGQLAVFLMKTLYGAEPVCDGDTLCKDTLPYFVDVPADHMFYKFVQKMKETGITAGCSSTQYCPDYTLTRGQMAVFLVKALYGSAPLCGSGVLCSGTNPMFNDVPTDHMFYEFIQKMKETGITAGCSSNEYCPNNPITRAQMAVFLTKGFLQ